MHPSAWAPWRKYFDSNGYDSVIAGRPNPTNAPDDILYGAGPGSPISFTGLLDGTSALLADLGRRPILVGHGIGAVIAQVLLDRPDVAAAVVAIAPPAAGWVCRTALLGHLRTRISLGTLSPAPAGRPTLPAFTTGYANTATLDEATFLYDRYVIPESVRPALQASWSWREPGVPGRHCQRSADRRPPLLLISGGKDRLCPERNARAWERFGRRRYPNDVTDHHVFPAAGHSLIVDRGWEDVADYCLDWLTSQNL